MHSFELYENIVDGIEPSFPFDIDIIFEYLIIAIKIACSIVYKCSHEYKYSFVQFLLLFS